MVLELVILAAAAAAMAPMLARAMVLANELANRVDYMDELVPAPFSATMVPRRELVLP